MTISLIYLYLYLFTMPSNAILINYIIHLHFIIIFEILLLHLLVIAIFFKNYLIFFDFIVVFMIDFKGKALILDLSVMIVILLLILLLLVFHRLNNFVICIVEIVELTDMISTSFHSPK